MTPEEAKARATAAEAKRRHEYYIQNKDRIRERQKAYQKAHNLQYAARSKRFRTESPLKYAETQLRHWTKKVKELKEAQENERME